MDVRRHAGWLSTPVPGRTLRLDHALINSRAALADSAQLSERWWRMGSGHNGPLPTSRSNDDDNVVC